MMKILIFLTIVVALFMFIFIESHTLEIYQAEENKEGIQCYTTKYNIHWDRFFNYIKDIPKRIVGGLSFGMLDQMPCVLTALVIQYFAFAWI